MTVPSGNSYVCYAQISAFPSASAWLRFSANKINCFLRDQSLSGNFDTGKYTLNLTAKAVVSQHLWVTVHCYPLMS